MNAFQCGGLRLGIGGGLAVIAAVVLTGCDMGMDKSANRFEQLNLETKDLLDTLRQITDEKSAKAHQAELEESAAKLKEIRAGIEEGMGKSKNPGGAMIVNYRQASIYAQTAKSAAIRIKQIREADAKAGDVVDKALAGLDLN